MPLFVALPAKQIFSSAPGFLYKIYAVFVNHTPPFTEFCVVWNGNWNRPEFTEFFWTFSIVLYYKKKKKHDVQWLRFALSKGPNWVGVFSYTFTWGRKHIQFPKRRVFFGIPDDGKSPEKVCDFCTTYTIVRILSSLSETEQFILINLYSFKILRKLSHSCTVAFHYKLC
jgi:hypothetical protein